MNTKNTCSFVAFNLFSFLSFVLMSANIPLGFAALGVTALFGMRYFPFPPRQRKIIR